MTDDEVQKIKTFVDRHTNEHLLFSQFSASQIIQAGFIERGIISAEALGLGTHGPWPVLLCGYLFQALNREAEVIRQEVYSPDIMDRYFH